MSLNKVMLIGHIGADPEVRTAGESKVARLRLATTESYTDRNGEKHENTEWHTINCWRKLAELCEKYVKKGSQLYIEGSLATRKWQDQSGNERYSTEITATNIQLLGKREGQSEQGAAEYRAQCQSGQAPANPPAQQQAAPAPGPLDPHNDDLPF